MVLTGGPKTYSILFTQSDWVPSPTGIQLTGTQLTGTGASLTIASLSLRLDIRLSWLRNLARITQVEVGWIYSECSESISRVPRVRNRVYSALRALRDDCLLSHSEAFDLSRYLATIGDVSCLLTMNVLAWVICIVLQCSLLIANDHSSIIWSKEPLVLWYPQHYHSAIKEPVRKEGRWSSCLPNTWIHHWNEFRPRS